MEIQTTNPVKSLIFPMSFDYLTLHGMPGFFKNFFYFGVNNYFLYSSHSTQDITASDI